MSYRPTQPGVRQDLATYVYDELLRISHVLDLIEEGRILPVRYAAPTRPAEGMLAVADGTQWNPGGGKGLYEYKSGNWSKL